MKFSADIFGTFREFIDGKSEPEGVRVIALVYWRVLLCSALVALVAIFFYGTWDLIGVLNAIAASTDTSAPPPAPFSRSALEDTVRTFKIRQTNFLNFKSSPPALIADPNR
jgi:hypothetical protein